MAQPHKDVFCIVKPAEEICSLFGGLFNLVIVRRKDTIIRQTVIHLSARLFCEHIVDLLHRLHLSV